MVSALPGSLPRPCKLNICRFQPVAERRGKQLPICPFEMVYSSLFGAKKNGIAVAIPFLASMISYFTAPLQRLFFFCSRSQYLLPDIPAVEAALKSDLFHRLVGR